MQLQAIAKGMAVGLTAGAVGYFITAASGHEKSKLKRRTVRAARAVGAVMDAVADIMH